MGAAVAGLGAGKLASVSVCGSLCSEWCFWELNSAECFEVGGIFGDVVGVVVAAGHIGAVEGAENEDESRRIGAERFADVDRCWIGTGGICSLFCRSIVGVGSCDSDFPKRGLGNKPGFWD